MIFKIFVFVAVHSTFLSQLHDVYSDGAIDVGQIFDFGIDENTKFEHDVVQNMVDEIYEILKLIFTGDMSGKVVRKAFTTARIVLTSEHGPRHILAFVDLISYVLQNPNFSRLLKIGNEELVTVAKDELNGGRVTKSLRNFVDRLSAQPQLASATEGYIEGLSYFLKDVPAKRMKSGVGRLANLANLSSFFVPKKRKNNLTKSISRSESYADTSDFTSDGKKV